jgi:hypothetical protein
MGQCHQHSLETMSSEDDNLQNRMSVDGYIEYIFCGKINLQ